MKAVAEERRRLGWSAQDLANICVRDHGLPISRSTIAKLESGHRSYVTIDEFIALASALGLDPSQFLALESFTQKKVLADSGSSLETTNEGSDPDHHMPNYYKLSEILNILSSRYRLAPREREVLGLLVGGFPNRNIATRLGVSPNTIARYVQDIYEKMLFRGPEALSRRGLVHIILKEAHIDIDEPAFERR
jgi:DNA-binding NarL/FixJ family response regulator